MERAEIERAKRKPTENLNAYDYYLRGMANLHLGTREAIDEALPLFEQAIKLDPDFASAYAMAAWCYVWRKVNGWMTDRPREIAEGARLARRAVELGRDDAVALTRGGHALAHLAGDLDGGIALLDRAVMLNPNLAAAWFLGGFLRVWNGEHDSAIEHFTRAMRLSPLDPETYRMQAGMAMAHMLAGRFDVASSWADEGVEGFAELFDGRRRRRGQSCAGRPDWTRAAGDGSLAPARPRAADIELEGLASNPARGRSRHLRRRPAQGRVAGVTSSDVIVRPAAVIRERKWPDDIQAGRRTLPYRLRLCPIRLE